MRIDQFHTPDCMTTERSGAVIFWYVLRLWPPGIVDLMDTRESNSMAADPERRFGGTRRLYGERVLQRFREAHICVIGIGGVGSWAAEALARTAVGRLTLVDLDHVAESNINRQLHALTGTLGMAKVQVMATRIRQINPDCRVTVIEEFLTLENLTTLLDVDYDHIIDCIDGYRIKAALIAQCRRRRIPLVTVGGAGGQSDPTRIRVADLSRTEHDALFSKTRKLLRRDYGFPKNLKRRFDVPCVYSDEQPLFPAADGGVCHEKPHGARIGRLNCAGGLGSSMAVTATFGLVAAAHALKKLAATTPANADPRRWPSDTGSL
jgi:tRNA A37 threonylcarbamoyladenosine dehydratase